MKIKAGIIGGAGYTGGELIRLLIHHPGVSVSFIHSRSNAGKPVHSVHQDLLGDTELKFSGELNDDVDVVFLCLGHGESKKFLAENKIADKVKVIDLANDFRLKQQSKTGKRQFVYGLPELNKEKIKSAANIANPGCFATSIQLGLLPLAKAGLLDEIYTTGITGSTGAGQSLSTTSHFSWRANNIQAYKTLTHQHLKEVGQSLQQAAASSQANSSRTQAAASGPATGSEAPNINFVPWRGDFTRGIFVTSQLRVERPPEEIIALYETFYKGHPFTILSQQAISLKQVVNTNKCMIQLEQQGSQLVVHSAVDNLLKGAAGQAVQTMNLLFGLDAQTGLHLKANAF